ncbi:L-2-amino-thiazoline-4-carboxylic acid hydrolase [Gehongia tenuis]|uniref:L-2-amino-thiazoline-4-carboxylic acid hydrolase n=1 Tax=Gehongia tenuis TaxID=2763655 RepID=A0A926HLI9_9FIRM|nr:L-2-amino-thiazoline-4-carboxylic acid hydrolase [Gehongia tenuis]MBC8532127.1 L-2-amino-thiazoline-4-carboxylic acid hydrolase [Gehongia tenuis]
MAAEKDRDLDLEPVSMYVLFARLFAHITKEVGEQCGEVGIQAVREGVRQFGLERGRDIARRAKALGHENDLEHYLSSYDMGRADDFNSVNTLCDEGLIQDFSGCVFAEQWQKDGTEKYGIHYCEVIDPSIAEGYNANMECIHDQHFFKDGKCHFCFRMKKES